MASTSNSSPAQTPLPSHDPPSQPASPHHKRTKHIEPAPSLDAATAAAAQPPRDTDTGAATPTPQTMGLAATPPMTLQVELLSAAAKAPTKGSAFAAGHDLYAARDIVIPARGRALVQTDIKISVPAGTYGRVAPRSGLAYKHGIDTLAGVIDADYRGPVGVILANLSETDFAVSAGDRVAQLVIERIAMAEVAVVEKLEDTVRGAGGFGSTGGFGVGAPTVNGV